MKRRRLGDAVLIVGFLLLAAVGAVYLFCFRGGGDTVTVTVDGQLYAAYPLSQDREVIIRTDGGEQNVLVIRNGKASVRSATCPDGICASHRPIFRDGESIVCLPHRVVITVTVQGDADAPDIVA
jgi:hypothetical protein